MWTGAKRPGLGTGRMRIDGKEVPAHRISWELAHGPLGDGGRVLPCPDEPACVRLEHLTIDAPNAVPRKSPKKRGRKGGGSMREVRDGVWELSVMSNPSSDRRPERLYRRVEAPSAAAAARELATFVEEVRTGGPPPAKDLRGITLNEAIAMFLDEHLAAEKGREHRTIADYRQLHDRWFAPELGLRPVRDIDEAQIDRAFGKMRAAGLSRSRLNHAKSLYRPFFRWAKSRRIIPRNPMLEFQLPTSTYVSKERTPPEGEELSMLLAQAVALTPEIAPVLVLGAVTGMRRGELVGLQRSRIRWAERRIVVNAAMDGKRVKATKTRMERSFFVDEATIAMLRRHGEHIEDLATEAGAVLVSDPFVFTLSIDGSEPMPAHYLTKRVAFLKEHLGIEEKKPVWSSADAGAAAKSRAKKLERAREDLDALARGLGGRHYPNADKVAARLAVIAAKRRVGDYLRHTVGVDSSAKPTLEWRFDQAALDHEAATDGWYCLLTNLGLAEADAGEVLVRYKGQEVVERRYGNFKGPIAVAPIFLKSNRRIEALLTVICLALLIFCLVERQVRQAIAPETTMAGFPGRPKARPTGRLIFAALSRLVLVPACATGPPVVPAPPEPAARILDLLEVDPTTTR